MTAAAIVHGAGIIVIELLHGYGAGHAPNASLLLLLLCNQRIAGCAVGGGIYGIIGLIYGIIVDG